MIQVSTWFCLRIGNDPFSCRDLSFLRWWRRDEISVPVNAHPTCQVVNGESLHLYHLFSSAPFLCNVPESSFWRNFTASLGHWGNYWSPFPM